MAESYRPPKAVQEEAQRAVRWIEQGKAGDGFTDTGRARAAQLARGEAVSADTVLRMYSFLKRHEVDKQATGFNAGEDGFPTPGRVAWSAWGGDAGLSWSTRIRDELVKQANFILEENAVAETRADAPYGVVTDPVAHGIMAADAALDAAQNLLAGNPDPVVSQAYYLLCAADAALDEAQEALGMVDADDELSEGEAVTGDAADQQDVARSEELVSAETRSRLAACEKLTVDAEIRAANDGSMRISGYAAKFNTEASALGFREQIAPGAFTRTLQSGEPVYLLVNHDTEQLPLASTGSGTLQLREDSTGLFMTADLDKSNPRAAELYSALQRQDVNKMSFMFTIAENGESRTDGLRTLTDVNLFEVSVVTWPAYDSTEVGVRSADSLADRARLVAARFLITK